jgi:signal transduction histidine kinase
MQVARDLHDLRGHGLTTITVKACPPRMAEVNGWL